MIIMLVCSISIVIGVFILIIYLFTFVPLVCNQFPPKKNLSLSTSNTSQRTLAECTGSIHKYGLLVGGVFNITVG
jgi:hypothetical protein